ncbi:hypothetical protein [Kineosporia sp. NBRC 101731]|uniref:hypothetical protein n=1 Tax=Kineosporia sp. NBRC 101731 TaxID=3032199 RepID=UPI0024A214BE|nr:hypothetical protein [Kineosporia sp. NBRC 101731]GLY29895.1 hypothetical protein Kisp02_32600 [Kineosporia sp. NBRC 101731]
MQTHFYTTDPAEKRARLDQGYRDETDSSASMFVFSRPVLHVGIRTTPLYRLRHRRTGDQIYTVDRAEATQLLGRARYIDEVRLDSLWVFRASSPKSAPPDAVALYRLWNRRARAHFYTRDRAEADHAVAELGYRIVPQQAYVLKSPALAEGITAVRLHRLVTGDD